MGIGIVGVGGPSRPAVDERLNDCEAAPGILILIGGGFPGLELVRYTIPVPVRGIGFENPGVVGVVGAVDGMDDGVPTWLGPDITRIRCWS